MFVIPALLSQATGKKAGRWEGTVLHYTAREGPRCGRASRGCVKELCHLLKEGNIAATVAGRLGSGPWASWRWLEMGPLVPQLGGT